MRVDAWREMALCALHVSSSSLWLDASSAQCCLQPNPCSPFLLCSPLSFPTPPSPAPAPPARGPAWSPATSTAAGPAAPLATEMACSVTFARAGGSLALSRWNVAYVPPWAGLHVDLLSFFLPLALLSALPAASASSSSTSMSLRFPPALPRGRHHQRLAIWKSVPRVPRARVPRHQECGALQRCRLSLVLPPPKSPARSCPARPRPPARAHRSLTRMAARLARRATTAATRAALQPPTTTAVSGVECDTGGKVGCFND